MRSLSRREIEVLTLVGEGYTHEQISKRLHVSPKTTRNQMNSVLRKLDVHDRAHAIVVALRAGYLPKSLVTSQVDCAGCSRTEELTPREIEVLKLASEGHSHKQIAKRLSYSEQTSKNQLNSIRRKLNANNTTQAVVLALRTGRLPREFVECPLDCEDCWRKDGKVETADPGV